MLVKGFLRLFSSKNLNPNRMSFPIVNPMHQNRFFLRNVHAVGNVTLKPGNDGRPNKLFKGTVFKEYIEKNNNFKNSAVEIANLNFTLDGKHESPKLLFQLKENSENASLYQEALDCLNRELSTFDMEGLLKVIALTLNLRMGKRFFEDFITSLDKELLSREFSFDEILEVLFVLRQTVIGRKSLKHFHFYLKTFRTYLKLHKFQPLQVIHIFYHLEEFSTLSKSYYKYSILKYVKENLSLFNTEEAGIIVAALAKAKLFKADNEFVQQITSKMINEIENVGSIHLFYLSKFLLGCSAIHHGNIILDFQEKLIPHISKFNASSLTLSFFSGYPYALNLSFWDKVIERLKTEIKTLDILNIHRLTRITATFKVNDEEFLKLALQAVEEIEDVGTCAPHLVFFCKDLVTHRIYSRKLLDIILSKDFIDKMLSRSFAQEIVEWAFINFTLQIEKPEYQCGCLNETLERKIMKKFFNVRQFGKPILTSVKTRIRLSEHLKKAYGKDEVIETYCLFHYERGVIMRFDENLNALPIPEEYRNNTKRATRRPLDEHIWICMNVCNFSSQELTPTQETYARHLSAIGYKPVLVHHTKFYHCLNLGTEETIKYLKSVIEAALKEVLQEKKLNLRIK